MQKKSVKQTETLGWCECVCVLSVKLNCECIAIDSEQFEHIYQ